MTAAEALAAARAAGLTLTMVGSKLRIRGLTAANRAHWTGILTPLASEIAALVRAEVDGTCSAGTGTSAPTCTLGQDQPDPCPACGWIHGRLDERPACHECGSADRRIAVCDDDGRICLDCLKRRRAPAATTGRRGIGGTQ